MADRVRYRIDGVCIVRDNIPKSMQAAVTARLKIMSGIDIAENGCRRTAASRRRSARSSSTSASAPCPPTTARA